MRFAILALLVFSCAQAQARLAEGSPRRTSSVCVKDVCITVEVVSKLKDMQRGLQGRDNLADHHGMLFVFDTDDFHNFWMKDMTFAIDMIWIDNQYHIAAIAPSRPPCIQDPCQVYTPSQKTRYVLEVPEGFAFQHQLKTGDVLKFNL